MNEIIHVIGETDFRNVHHRFGLLAPDRLRHTWILGKTGVGKSTLLTNLIAQDLARGNGLALLDPHGDLVDAVLPLVPKARTNDVLLFAPADTDYPVSFNIFRRNNVVGSNPALLASELISVFRKQWSGFWGPRLEHILRQGILAIARDPRATLLFLYRFLTDKPLREAVVARLPDPVVQKFWVAEFPSYGARLQAEALAPILNKLGAFVAHPVVRNIVGQERSKVDVGAVLDRRGIILADLSTGRIGEDASHLLGGLMLSAILLSATYRRRADPPFYVYLDEFQHFVNDSLATMLAEARKFGLGLTMAHQYLDQLPESTVAAIIGNVATKIVFRVGATDAVRISPEFEPAFTAPDLESMRPFHMAVKLIARGAELAPFSARSIGADRRAADALERIRAIREQSRARFAEHRAVVERHISESLRDLLNS